MLQRLPEVRLLAIPVRPWRAKELAKQGLSTARDISEAAQKGATHCIIATDTRRHAEDALVALECGLDVLVEKPLAPSASEANVLTVRAKENGHKLFVGCVMRFSDSLSTFRNLLGRLGRLHHVRIECQSYLPEWRPARPYQNSYSAGAAEGGVLRDLIHEIDYAGWIFGWPSVLQARVRNLERLGIEAEESVELFWETTEGCAISVSLDYLSRPSRRRMSAAGEWGTLKWDGIKNVVILALADTEEQITKSSQIRDEMLLAQDCAFINASERTWDARLATAEEGVKALAVCDGARRASENRREEKVSYL